MLFSEFIDKDKNSIRTGDIKNVQNSKEKNELYQSKYMPTLKPNYGWGNLWRFLQKSPWLHGFFRIHCWNDFGKNVGSSCPDLELRYFIECLDQEGFDINHHVRNERSPFVCQAEEEKGISVLL